MRGLDEERRTNSGVYYFAAPQFPGRNVTFAIRTAGDAAALAASARAAVVQEIPQAPLFDVRTMDERLDRARIGRHTSMILATTFALVALFLVIIGLYGVMAFEVRLRTREIAIRLALGAPVSTIFRMVLREGAAVVLIGLVIGAVGLKALATVLQAQLFATAVFDPLVLGTVALVVTACAFAACVVPAREAARTDAVSVLANT